MVEVVMGLLAQISGQMLLCLLILTLPTLTLGWTLLVICQRGHFRNLRLFLALNVAVAVGIAAIAFNAEQGTFYKMAEAGYYMAFVCAFYFIAPVLYRVVMYYYGPEPQEIKSNNTPRST